MIEELPPEVVLVYGGMPEYIFGEFKNRTQNVIAVYQIDKGSSTPRLVTNYVEGK